jgi:hypothetical protein
MIWFVQPDLKDPQAKISEYLQPFIPWAITFYLNKLERYLTWRLFSLSCTFVRTNAKNNPLKRHHGYSGLMLLEQFAF